MSEGKKKDKTLRVLQLYHRLLKGERINKVAFCMEHEISSRAFDRDIEDLRIFLTEIYSSNELVYDYYNKTYNFKNDMNKTIDPMHSVLISKLLLETRTLNNEEMIGLIEELLINSKHKLSSYVKDFITKEIENYSGSTDVSILKMVEDLIETISLNYDICLQLYDNSGNITEMYVSPLNTYIECNELYLLCCDMMNFKNIYKLKIDCINSFRLLKSNYALINKLKYYDIKER